MLNAMRSRAGSIAAKALLILLALSFMAWGVTDYIGGGGVSGDAARAGDTAVTPQQFVRAFEQDVRRMRTILGPGLTREDAYAMGAADETARRLVNAALLIEESRALGVIITDEQVRRMIEGNNAFRSALGVFDRAIFSQTAANMGYGEQAFIERFREDAAANQVLSAAAGSLNPPDALTDAFMRRRAAVRTVAFIDLPLSALPAAPEPADAELSAYHAENEARFTAPELRRVTFVRLDPEILAGSVEISETELAEAFEARRGSYETPERRRVKQMILPDESAARAAKTRIDGGEDFDAVALDAAGMEADAADLGLVGRLELSEDMAAPAFELALGQASAPVQTPFGWHVLTVSEIEAGETPSLNDVRAELIAELRQERAADEVYAVSTALEDALGGGAALEEAARQMNLSVETLDAVSENGTGAGGETLENLPGDGRAFVTEIFAGETGIESVLTEDGGDGYFVVRVDEVSEPRLKPLDEVRAAAAAAWRAEQRAEQGQKHAAAARDKLAAGAALNEIAAELGAAARFSPSLRRDGTPAGGGTAPSENTPAPALLDAAFAAGEGEAVLARTQTGWQLGRVEAAGTSPAPDAAAVRENIKTRIAGSLAGDVTAAFSEGLRARHDTVINRAVIEALLGPQDGG